MSDGTMVAGIARQYGWRPVQGDQVSLPDGTLATVTGSYMRQNWQCKKCDRSHLFPDVITDRSRIMGVGACELAPTVETARTYLLQRAAGLDAAIAEVPGYPANGRWAAEASELRAAAAALDGMTTVSDGTTAAGDVVDILLAERAARLAGQAERAQTLWSTAQALCGEWGLDIQALVRRTMVLAEGLRTGI